MSSTCSRKGQCGWNARVGGCIATPRRGVGDGTMCLKCHAGQTKLNDEFGAQKFVCDALELWASCRALAVLRISAVHRENLPTRRPTGALKLRWGRRALAWA
eukprot:3469521-Pyramimonas_sp.AAC.1